MDALTTAEKRASEPAIHEHTLRLHAEQKLLKSLAKEKVSNALSPVKKIELRDPNDPTFQPAIFGEGLAEVSPSLSFSRTRDRGRLE